MTQIKRRNRDGAQHTFSDATYSDGRKVGRPPVLFDENGLKKCSRCGRKKSKDDYHKDRTTRSGYASVCAQCKVPIREASNEKVDRVDYLYQYKYKISRHQFEEMLLDQNFQCKICGVKFEGNESGQERICVDHDHDSGKVRGLLCRFCNIGLGKFKDHPENLRRAADYIEEFYNGAYNGE